jgi:uncharacterized protein YdaU (DUF1376 family)
MKYYQRNLGDYARDSGWLSTYQHGVYSLILDWYYANERAPSVDLCYRIVKARSGPERKATNEVLLAFFDLNKEPGFAHNKHADLAIGKYKDKAHANSLIAQEREDTKRARNVPKSDDVRAHSVQPIQYPVTKNQEESKEEATPVVPKGDSQSSVVVDAYHRLLPKCQRVEVPNPKRLKRIAAAVKLAKRICSEQGWPYGDGAAFWESYFTECANDPWMRGDVPHPTRPSWKQNLEVLLAEDRFANVMDRAIASMRRAA